MAHVVNQERIRRGGLFLCVLGQCISKTQGANRLATIHNMVLSMDNRVGNAILIRLTLTIDQPKPTANPILTLWWIKPVRVPCTYQQGDWDRGWGLRYGRSRATERERRYLKEPRYVTAPTFVVLSDRLNKSAKWKHTYFRTSCNNCGKPASDQYFMDYRASMCRPSP